MRIRAATVVVLSVDIAKVVGSESYTIGKATQSDKPSRL